MIYFAPRSTQNGARAATAVGHDGRPAKESFMGYTYSFLDVQAAISGPGGNFPLAGDESGISEEGITIDPRATRTS